MAWSAMGIGRERPPLVEVIHEVAELRRLPLHIVWVEVALARATVARRSALGGALGEALGADAARRRQRRRQRV